MKPTADLGTGYKLVPGTGPHRASEPLIFERSVSGRRGFSLPPLDVPMPPAGVTAWIPAERLRAAPAALPEVSERELVQHFMKLAHQNFSVETNFYPLGSCTMKYNPRIHEELTALPGFSTAHPYEPDAAVQGTLQLLGELGQWLGDILGMDGVTLQPAAGAHGEFTGLLMARAYHEAQGRSRKKVVVPDSSHGTNPASAALCGYEVVEVRSNARGRVDLAALHRAVDQDTAVFMLTNPNTLGLFEEEILEISRLVHGVGGLMYLDGANMNALLGLFRPGDMGFDITHVNIHKTFSIPHGSGGPGGGPVGVKRHLVPFLPGPLLKKEGQAYRWVEAPPSSIGRVRAFAGNIGAMVRAYLYIKTLGAEGLRHVAEHAILNANYLKARLKTAYTVPVDEPCMHEFVASAVEQKRLGVKALDIAKRLLDYGCYAPTIYFPLIVEEALMIEPSETESRQALDQFADALLAIAQEAKTNPGQVQMAPHTLPVERLDEVRAAREPNLRWRPSPDGARPQGALQGPGP
ncbi:MAG: aminomethyl-transferring glycine dehydrogenase subunit GcvPB [Candidatus Omnitrophica bacterium]|nr:aminomethyl-transferring glycine dehydrogenase subunit GcvPB [Candidatus Omnitrophota bacterium]